MAVNSKYWQDRFNMLQESQLNKGQKYYYELDQQYKKASMSIEKDIAVWYSRFAKNNKISFAEAKKMLMGDSLKEFKWNVADYIKYGEENALNQRWMKELENASAKVHISRLEALKIQMQQQIEVLYGNQVDGIDRLASNIYTEGYYHTAYEIQKGFNVGYGIVALNATQLSHVISKPWSADNLTFTDRCWTSKQQLISALHTGLTQSIIRGDSPDKLIKTISNKFNVSKNKAGRLVMTESAFFSSAAQKDCFNSLNVEKFEVVATLDLKTSAICQELDGKVFIMKDYAIGVTAPPFHCWCRTVTVPYFDDNFGERAAKGADGKTYYVPSNMNYKDWYNKHVKGNPGEEIAAKKLKNSYNDKQQHEKYKTILGNDVPNSFDKFQELKYNNVNKWNELKERYPKEFVTKDSKDIAPLFKERLSDLETRNWYKWHDENIPTLIDKSKSIEEQAMQAHNLRNTYRTQARDLMKNQEERKRLDLKYPNSTFEELLEHKKLKYGLSGKEAYEDIVRSSQTTNKKYDKIAGIEEG